jgi:YD repeat-containing protein
MKTILSALGFLLASTSLHAQYYYNDIIGTQETNRQMKAYLSNKIRTMSATGSDRNGTKATDFSEFHEVRENGKALKATSIINLNRAIIYSRFDDQGRVISMADSSTNIISVTTYEYDAAGRVSRVQNTVKDSANDFNQVETHQWYYNGAGKAERMWRIITTSGTNTSVDSMEVRMVADEDGNPGEEHTYKRGIETGYLYYYYDDKNRLTDIVRYNTKLQKLLPDLMFEYDDNDRVIQKITTTSSNMVGYLIWRYIYNDKGLKTKEALFNRDKELTGKIDYTYTYNQ